VVGVADGGCADVGGRVPEDGIAAAPEPATPSARGTAAEEAEGDTPVPAPAGLAPGTTAVEPVRVAKGALRLAEPPEDARPAAAPWWRCVSAGAVER
jgi:hypothetical protein